jgi:hypothetical protein
VYARRKPNGDLWGEVAFLNRAGHLVTLEGTTADEAIPLADPTAVEQYLGSIVERLFAAVAAKPVTSED